MSTKHKLQHSGNIKYSVQCWSNRSRDTTSQYILQLISLGPKTPFSLINNVVTAITFLTVGVLKGV